MADKKRISTVTASDIKAVRGSLTQKKAWEMLNIKRTAYQSYERGTVAMSEATFEYFKKMARKALREK